MSRVVDMIASLEYEELLKMKNDLGRGAIHLQRLVKDEIKNRQKQHNVVCSVCQNRIDPDSTNNYTLIFGPDDFKKKATFCALDCMEYFMNSLKGMKKG